MTSWRQTLFTPGKLLAAVILAVGGYATVERFIYGLGSATNLNDATPWGLWVGFKLCAVALAAGGFTLTALVHLFGQKRYHAILHSTVLTAFLGYLSFSTCLLFDLGKPYNMWHVIIMWNPHSVMFEVSWCVMLYTAVLTLEFCPVVLAHFGLKRPLELLRKVSIFLVLAGVLLSTLHQSSLGTMFLVVPGKLYPLWYTPYIPVMFFFSALCAGFSMVIFESYMSSHFFHKGLEKNIIKALARFLFVFLLFYLAIKFEDLVARRQLGMLFKPRLETYCFWLEIVLLVAPILAFCSKRVRDCEHATFLCAVTVMLGIMVNRFNVSVIGLYASSQAIYLPSFREVAILAFLITVFVIAFGVAVKYFNIFEHEPQSAESAQVPERVLTT